MCVYKGLLVLQKGVARYIEGQCFRRGCLKRLVCVGGANLCLGKFVSKGT